MSNNIIPEAEVKTFNWKKGRMIILVAETPDVIPITEIHFKEDGRLDDTPSFGLVLGAPGRATVISQISLYTLNKSLAEFGYQITPIQEKT